MLEFICVPIRKPDDVNCIIGQSHFIKTVEDLAETLLGAVPGIRFGLAFCEASGACKIRSDGTDPELKKLAEEAAAAVAAGHAFFIFLRHTYPINVLNAVKMVQEVCSIYCATANPLEVVVARTQTGSGIMGVVDGAPPKGVETEDDIAWRSNLLRTLGYKRAHP
jgi:hypothetical protein